MRRDDMKLGGAVWSRRHVIKSAVALPSAAFVGGALAPWAAGLARSQTLALERCIYDVRFAEANDIAQLIGARGVALSPIADDLMDLWYDDLDVLWKSQPMPLAGITLPEALFVLETLALDRQMRVVYRGRHSTVEDGRIAHTLAGPAALVERFAALPPDADWQSELAAAMTECPLGAPEPAEVRFVTDAPGLSIRDEPLVSWIIAPRSAVALTIPNQE